MAWSSGLRPVCLLIFGFFVVTCGNSPASAGLEARGELALADPLIQPLDSPPALILSQRAIEEPAQPPEKDQSLVAGSEKSPGKAFVFSFLVPGTGEFYLDAHRGYIFLGVEAVAWASSYFLRESGNKKETEFEHFADQHWAFPVVGSVCNGSPYTAERDSLMREYYQHNKQHFYEDIGKQPFNLCGWDSPQNLGSYLDMRDKSNWLLKNSNYALMAAVVNHVISAVDALRLARNYNARLGYGVKLNLKFKTNPRAAGVMIVASRKF